MEENKKESIFKKILKKEIIISLAVGLLLGIVIMLFVTGGVEAYVSGNLITKGELYGKMKNYYSIDLVLEDADQAILNKKYDLSEEEINKLKETADKHIEQYEMYGYTQEEFLEHNGFESYDSFVEFLSLDYKRSMYVYDYLETQLEENAVKNYYNENAFGKINNKHILVKTSEDMTAEQALVIAKEIISKLDKGESFDTLATEYTTKYSGKVITEDLGEIGAFDNLESAYINALKQLETGKYTTEPVKTSYGYHIIYCTDKKEKTEEISASDKMAIVDTLATQIGLTLDETIYYKALIQMREEAGLKFFDKDFKEKYEEYCKPYVDQEKEEVATQTNETELNISLATGE